MIKILTNDQPGGLCDPEILTNDRNINRRSTALPRDENKKTGPKRKRTPKFLTSDRNLNQRVALSLIPLV